MNRKWFAFPYLVWMLVFIVAPFVLILVFSFLTKNGLGEVSFTFDNYKHFLFFDDGRLSTNVMVLVNSLWIALLSTVICLLIGYPVAYFLARGGLKGRGLLILLFILPMWMNFLLRTYALMGYLSVNSVLNRWANFLGFSISGNQAAVTIGMVYNYLPFMILPIYSVLKKMDPHLIEAAQDLGANRRQVFTRITLPMSVSGIMSGVTMVFMPAVSTFAIARILSGKMVKTFGDIIEEQIFIDKYYGSALSIVVMVFVLISMAIFARFNKGQEGGRLW